MAAFQLYSECSHTSTNISNLFIDKFMPEANGEFVKVYLYLLRCLESNPAGCSVSAIADCFNHTEKDVMRALKYWERVHLLRLEYDGNKSIRGIYFLQPEDAITDYGAAGQLLPPPLRKSAVLMEQTLSLGTPTAQSVIPTEETVASATATPTLGQFPTDPSILEHPAESLNHTSGKTGNITPMPSKTSRRNYTPDEIKEFRKDSNVSELFFVIETYLKRPLTATDTNTILYWYDELHFTTDLIDYLVQYCITNNHSSMRYMDKVALGWAEKNLLTVEDAKANTAQHSKAYYGVMKALGISGRNLADSEQAYLTRWIKEYGFELSLIQEACRRTIAATHQPSFEYTDSILKNWKANQVHSLVDIQKLDEAHTKNRKSAPAVSPPSGTKHNKFNNFNQRDYNYDQLEELLLNTSVQ